MSNKKAFRILISLLVLFVVVVFGSHYLSRNGAPAFATESTGPGVVDNNPTPTTTQSTSTGTLALSVSKPIPVTKTPAYLPQSFTFREQAYDEGVVFDYYYVEDSSKEAFQIGRFRGSMTWSPDGKYVGINCPDNLSDLCVLSMDKFLQPTKEGQTIESVGDNYEKVLPLPEACTNLLDPIYGLLAISWSSDMQKIAVLCGKNNYQEKTQVCIISLTDNRNQCWEQEEQYQIIQRIAWSPTEEKLAVVVRGSEFGPRIFLVSPDGSEWEFLTNGWSPSWSSDGQQIVFARYLDDDYKPATDPYPYEGLAIINVFLDEPNLQWVYKNENERIPKLRLQCFPISCRVSWSSDGKYVAFTNEYGLGPTMIYLLEIETKEIWNINELVDGTTWSSEQDWRP